MSQAIFTYQHEQNTIIIERRLNAPREAVWEAWTNADLLEQWWAPEPWKAVTKTFDFKPEGKWLYYMAGTEGEKSWSFIRYQEINAPTSFKAIDGFCDENGDPLEGYPSSIHWNVEFIENGKTSNLKVTLTFESEKDKQKLMEMQFEGGFSMGLNQLERLLQG